MARRDVIVVGASAGGIEALTSLVSGLPAELPASVLVVLHIPPDAPSLLAHILARASKLRVVAPTGPVELAQGTLYVAIPDHHLTLDGNLVHPSHAAPVDHHRPAIDVLFESAARSAGARVIGVVLSGMLHDGTAGMLAIKRAGGLTQVQDPADALYAAMPASVLEKLRPDHVLRAVDLSAKLVELAGKPVPEGQP